jgi:excisionase family DNA binding protein
MIARFTPDQITDSGVLSVAEAARHLGISPATLYAWIYREKIPAFKLDGRWKLNRAYVLSIRSGEIREAR